MKRDTLRVQRVFFSFSAELCFVTCAAVDSQGITRSHITALDAHDLSELMKKGGPGTALLDTENALGKGTGNAPSVVPVCDTVMTRP